MNKRIPAAEETGLRAARAHALSTLRPVPPRFVTPLQHPLARVALFAVAVLLAGAIALFAIEPVGGGQIKSFDQALWYGIVTMTGVGYGDFTPITGAGRVVGVLLMLGGMGLLTVLTQLPQLWSESACSSIVVATRAD